MVRLTELEGEFCQVLAELRYLSSEQIHVLWFPDRPLSSVKRRLRDLRASGYLRSIRRHVDARSMAWRLGGQGFRQLRDLYGDRFTWYQEIKPQFIEHLLETNQIWIALAGSNPVLAHLPFVWLGSHRARFEFVSMDRNRRRTRYVNPDALVRRRGRGGPRLFVELDRGTETIKERAGKRTIVGKLKAYRAAFVLPLPGERHPAYAVRYRDGRPPRVVFVLARDNKRKRARAIAKVAEEVTPELDVECIQLDDREALGGMLGAPAEKRRDVPAATQAPPPRRAEIEENSPASEATLTLAATFYKAVVLELRAAGVTAHRFPELADLQRAIRERLQKPPSDRSQLVDGDYRRFFRASLDVLEKRRPRADWSPALLAAEAEIRPVLKLGPAGPPIQVLS